MSILLFPHNQIAYRAALQLMEEEGKAAIIHPTGTGKSFIAFKLAEDYPDARICWLAPSEYIFRTQLENLANSEKKKSGAQIEAGKGAQQDVMHAGESRQKTFLGNITFLTYSKLMMDEEIIEALKPDYIILDEFHRCGASEWGKSVQKLLLAYPKARILGLSATSVRYLDNQRDMAEELFDGVVASEMTLGEAIAKEILPAPTYVVSMYSYGEELRRLQKRAAAVQNEGLRRANEEILQKLKRSLEHAEGLEEIFARHMKKNGKYILFCSDREHMDEMAGHVRNWFYLLDAEPHIYRVYYDNPKTEREFADFKKDESEHLKLLFCIDMLNEGVHVADIDGVVLLRPTTSPILYLQQIGRSLAVGGDRQPVVFDIVNNFDGLCCIDSLQKELEDAFSLLECTRVESSKIREQFRIIDEARECRLLFEQLQKNLSASWEIYYVAAASYYKEHGKLNVPKRYVTGSGLTLGSWIQTQRRVREGKVAGTLTKEQIAKLDEIGMIWESKSEQSFRRGYEALAQYCEKYGNADVKASYVTEDGYQLGRWVSNIRQKWNAVQESTNRLNGCERVGKAGYVESDGDIGNDGEAGSTYGVKDAGMRNAHGRRLTIEQIQMLDELGMIWDKNAHQWNKNYEAAAFYYKEHRNLEVPYDYCTQEGCSLGMWIQNLRQIYLGKKAGAAVLTEDQIRRLDAIGMVWNTKSESIWEEKYTLARQYYVEHGNLDIPSGYCVGDVQLGKWIATIRLKRKNPKSSGLKLSEERIKQLDAIGMEWTRGK